MLVYLHYSAVVVSQTYQLAQNSEKIWTYSSSRSSKVDDFGTNRKGICDFLLVINSNFGPILHRFWDTATYCWKLRIFATPVSFGAPLPIFPSEFHGEVKRQETRVKGLHCGKDCMILASTVFDWSTRVTVRKTDGRAIAVITSTLLLDVDQTGLSTLSATCCLKCLQKRNHS